MRAAEKRCRVAIRRDPDDWNAHYLLGVTLRQQGDYERALDAYERALRNCPRRAPILTARGIAYQQLGRYEEAIAAFGEALQLEPDSVECLNSLALTHKRAGQPYKSLYNYCLALRACSSSALRTVIDEGGAEEGRDQHGERTLFLNPGFVDIFQHALRGTPYFVVAHNIGMLLGEIGHHARSMAILEDVAEQQPIDELLIIELMREAEEAVRRG